MSRIDRYKKLNAEIGTEFDRYVLENPAFADRIPFGAEVILQLEGHRGFNAWQRRIWKAGHESGRPAIVVTVRKLRPLRSRLVGARVKRIEAA